VLRGLAFNSAFGSRASLPARRWGLPRAVAGGTLSDVAWPAAGFLAAAIAGVALSRQGRLPHLALAAEAGCALFIIVWRLGARSLWVWVLLTGALYPFLRLPSDHPIVTFDRIWILACASCVLVNRRRIATSRPLRLLIFAFGWLAIAFGIRAFTTSGPNLGFQAITDWLDIVVLPLILFLAAAKLTVTRHDAQRIGAAIALGGVVLACIGIAEKALGFQLASYTGGSARFDAAIAGVRISGPFPAPEPYALCLLICMAATLYWLQARPAYFLGGSAVLIQSVALALTFFRAAWIAGIVVLLIMVSRPGRHARSAFILLYAVAIGLLAFTQLQHNRQFAARANNTENVDARLATYKQALGIFRSSPYTGVGVDQYNNVASKLPETKVNGVASVPYPHDSYLGVLAEQGLVGIAPLIASTIAVWYALRRFKRRMTSSGDALLARAATAAAIAYLLMSIPLDMFTYGPSNAFLALLLGVAAGRYDALRGDSRRGSTAVAHVA
jgi:O-antigen ligase